MDETLVEARNSVQLNFARANGGQQVTAILDVRCGDATSARREMVNLLRSLALDIEAGAA
jgi:hypothetical protein